MANSIRTPRQGTTPGSRRIAQAVDDEEWQKFRLSLKGISTRDKLNNLCEYWNQEAHNDKADPDTVDCDVCIRVDNYIKALCRGGQLHPGESLRSALIVDWNLIIKS
jgi:hypothetical protein